MCHNKGVLVRKGFCFELANFFSIKRLIGVNSVDSDEAFAIHADHRADAYHVPVRVHSWMSDAHKAFKIIIPFKELLLGQVDWINLQRSWYIR